MIWTIRFWESVTATYFCISRPSLPALHWPFHISGVWAVIFPGDSSFRGPSLFLDHHQRVCFVDMYIDDCHFPQRVHIILIICFADFSWIRSDPRADQYSIFCIKSRYMVATGFQVTSCVHRFGPSQSTVRGVEHKVWVVGRSRYWENTLTWRPYSC